MTSARAITILSRFPRHLALDEPGTLFAEVVDALAGHLDRQLADLGRVRRAHRLGQVDELVDLFGLAALHGLRDELLEPVARRLDAVAVAAQALAAAAAPGLAPADQASLTSAALARLPDALSLAPEPWPAAPGELASSTTLARMATTLAELASYAEALQTRRRVIMDLIDVHRSGNGSPTALLHAAASLLGLRPGRVQRSGDDYWHLMQAQDGLRPLGAPTPRTDLLALEENPEADMTISPVPRRHRELFTVQRRGFGPVPTDVRVTARDDRCVWPMVVDIHAGRALVYAGALIAGQQLRFSASGRVELDGDEVGAYAFSIDGGVFADADSSNPRDDFVFADAATEVASGERLARFGLCRPVADALDDGALPHGGGLLPSITLRVGVTALRFFVREAAFGTEAAGTAALVSALDDTVQGVDRPLGLGAGSMERPAVPLYAAGVFDASVAGDAGTAAPAADIGFDWRERQPYTCQLWLPRRFASLDGPGRIELRERMRLALERFRPAGVYLGVAYADDLWTLGEGVLRDATSAEPDGLVVHGTRLVPAASAAVT
ncbi:MAG: hypothetical protein RIQ60_677 [Pseudomonadota bacterium]|jgi:hypothetical protein